MKTRSPGSFRGPVLSRRSLLAATPALFCAPRLLGQSVEPVPVQKLHSFEIRVSNPRRSVAFYQDLFGAAVQAHQGPSVCLRIGEGPGFFKISPLGDGESPGIKHIGLSVQDFDPVSTRARLARHGVEAGAAPDMSEGGLGLAMRSWLEERGQAQGGDYGGTPELFFADAEGLVYHLVSTDYCGGSGPLGERCPNIETPSQPGLFELVDISHFTNFMANRSRANDFITGLFGKSYQAYQGEGSPVIGMGDGLQFLMYVGGDQSGRPERPGRIDHVCFSMRDFAVDRVLEQLTDYGLQPRQDPADTQPLMHWISMRMPNRGGAPGGTPELYFSDPDGIRIQLQDPGYCGGTGYLGDSCPPLA